MILVDDGSEDGTVAWVAAAHPGVRVIHQTPNQGFGAAVNAGVRAARHGHVVLLNNDMRAEPDFLTPLMAPFRAPGGVFATTPRIVNRTFGGDEAVTACRFRLGLLETLFPERGTESSGEGGHGRQAPSPGTHSEGRHATEASSLESRAEHRLPGEPSPAEVWSARADESGPAEASKRAISLALDGTAPSPSEVLFACGGAAAINRSLWEALGGLDPLFAPFYWEDVDLSWRARRRGWPILHVPASVVHHEHGATIGARFERTAVSVIYERNRLLFHWKNLTSTRLLARHLLWLPPRLVRALFGRPAFLRGFVLALRRAPAALRARRIERAASRVSDEEILERFHEGRSLDPAPTSRLKAQRTRGAPDGEP